MFKNDFFSISQYSRVFAVLTLIMRYPGTKITRNSYLQAPVSSHISGIMVARWKERKSAMSFRSILLRVRFSFRSACIEFCEKRKFCQETKIHTQFLVDLFYMDHVERIWYLSPMWAVKVQASLRICAVSPEPPLLAHTSRESRGTFRQKARSLFPLNGWACAAEICHDGMLEDTNSLDRAHLMELFLFVLKDLLLHKYNLSRLMTKPTKWHVRLVKTQISLGIRSVWSESSLSAWRKLGSFATHWVHSKDSDQTGLRLIGGFAGRTAILLVLSWGGSFTLQIVPP